jgi:hypothetical protein
MSPELKYYFILTLFIAICAVIIAAPHFPNSDVSQEKNNAAFISMTVIGSVFILPALVWLLMIFKANILKDINYMLRYKRINSSGSLVKTKKHWWNLW